LLPSAIEWPKPAAISDQFHVYLVPAGSVFAMGRNRFRLTFLFGLSGAGLGVGVINVRRIIIGLAVVVVVIAVLGGIGFLVWTSNPYPPMPQALDALKSDSQVNVSTSPWLVFEPHASQATMGFIFYRAG